MRRRIIGLAFCIAVLAVNAAAQGGSDSGGGPPATATIAVSGTEQQVSGAWDTASITISFNGYSETVSPGQYSSSASIASAFAAKFSRDDTSNGLSAQVICGSSSSLISFALASGTYGTVSITGSTTSFNMTPVGFQSQTVPTVTWPTPAPIGYGTALSTIQLDATASVPGTFAYSPASGTIPATGTDTLSVTFTPTSSAYSTVTKTVSLTVLSSVSDTGTVTLTVGGVMAATTTYGANATPSSIASGLASGVTAGSFVNLTAINDGLNLVAKVQGAGTNYAYSIQTTSYDSTDFSQPSFAYPVLSGSLDGGANADSTGQTQSIYIFNGVYDGVGNLITNSDSAMGNWSYTYDSLNRLVTGTPSSGTYNGQYLCWAYDPFGNRTAESFQSSACTTVQPTATFNVINQPITASGIGASAGYSFTATFTHDAAGNVIADTTNQYLYDAEGRLCAVENVKFGNSMIGYLYGADGTRVAKGSISSMSCDPIINHFATMSDYILGPSNEQLTELDLDSNGVMAWQHTNIWAGGKLLGTYDVDGTHFYFDDPLGTRRAQTDYAGVLEKTCQSLPYGNSESCPPSPTEHLFAGKERDAESGLDYFGARYMASSMGRFMSPDEPVDQHPADPQSWNMYSYVRNNPLILTDPTGNYACGQMTAAQCSDFNATLVNSKLDAATALSEGRITGDQYNTVTNAIGAYGTLNDGNGVTVNVGPTQDNAPGTTDAGGGGTITAANPTGQNIQVTFNSDFLKDASSNQVKQVTGHEGSHVEDAENWASAGYTEAARPTRMETEFRAYGVTTIYGRIQGYSFMGGSIGGSVKYAFWDSHFPDRINNALRTTMIKALYPLSDMKAWSNNTTGGSK